MYKKKLAMDTSHNHEELGEIDPLAPEVTLSENAQENGGEKSSEKKKKGRKSFVLKIGTKRAKNKKEALAAPGPDDNGEYEVEAIVDHKKQKGKTLYRVRWKGYKQNHDSWLSSNDLSCKELLRKYRKRIEKDNKDVYNVEKIIDHRRLHGTTYYRIRWEGYSAKDDTWQSKETLNCKELLKEYNDKIESEIMEREKAKLEALQNAKQSNNEYEVEAIMGKRSKKGKDGVVKTKYLIRWKGWGEEGDTWEPEETLNCNELIRAFNKKNTKASKTPIKKKKASNKRKRNYDSSGSESDDSDDSDYGASKRVRSSGEYEVAKIINARINRQGKWEFFVMWKGFGPEDNTWEPESNLNCTKLINDYLGKNKIPRSLQTKLEQMSEASSVPKPKRKPPTERKPVLVGSKGLRGGRTKGEMKTKQNFRLNI